MRRLGKRLSALAVLMFTPAVFAQGPDVPPTPTDPGTIQGFIQALLANIRAFVEGLIGALPI